MLYDYAWRISYDRPVTQNATDKQRFKDEEKIDPAT
jgi:hypothetical protein